MFFTAQDRESIDNLRQAYRRLAVQLHPDKHEETESAYWTKQFQQMQNEYDVILSQTSRQTFEDSKTTYEREKTLQDMIDKVLNIRKAYVEVCGCWLWVTVPFLQRHKIKALGFRWSKKKQRWYWGLTLTRKKQKARYASMQEVYDRYGKQVLTSKEKEQLLIGG